MFSTGSVRAFALALLVSAAACAPLDKPGPQSVAGKSPDGTISMTEIIAVGTAGGKGTLHFQGQSHAFKLIGGVTGGVGAADKQVRGEVYNLNKLSDFNGFYTQNSGGIGLDTSKYSDIWLSNKAGVVLHLTGTQEGMTLSLGREQILIEMF